MKTDDLVQLLATGVQPVSPYPVGRRFGLALLVGLPAAVVLMLLLLGLRPDLARAAHEPMFWIKLLFAASLGAAALLATERLSRPGVALGVARLAVLTPLALLWLLAAWALMNVEPSERAAMVWGSTWSVCPVNIALLSLPLFAATLWALRGLAPTRLALAGASAGLLSGALAALVYALHCPESDAPFLAIWYVLGMALPTVLGAALGPRLLRW